MTRAVFDTNVLVSAFLTRHQTGGVSIELLRFVVDGVIRLYLSPEIVEEVARTLLRSERMRSRYRYTPELVVRYCADLLILGEVVPKPSPIRGAVPRDPDDDKIVACAVAASAAYIVTRDDHLLSLGSYGEIEMITPEAFVRATRLR